MLNKIYFPCAKWEKIRKASPPNYSVGDKGRSYLNNETMEEKEMGEAC